MKIRKKMKKHIRSRKTGVKPKGKTAQSKIYKTRRWGQLVVLALVVMIVTIILDIFYMDFVLANNLQPMIDAIDIPVTLVLFSDVAMRFKDSQDKKKFVKKNMILIFSVLPISFALIGFRFQKLFPAIMELPLLSELIALEKVVKVQHGAKFLEALKSVVRNG